MGIINLLPNNASPGKRTRMLAEDMGKARSAFQNNTLNGAELMLYGKLSAMQCWDAALYCAWSAKGIESNDINMSAAMFSVATADNYSSIFGANVLNSNRTVRTAAELMAMPEGCFVGFISSTGKLRHCMLHLSDGIGAGNKSDCVLSDAHTIGWEILDMGQFFFKDKNLNTNSSTTIVYAPVEGQTVSRPPEQAHANG